MKYKTIAEQFAERGECLTFWARKQGLSDKDIRTLLELSQGTLKGAFGRARELRKMLEAQGFKFNCEAKIKPHSKKRKYPYAMANKVAVCGGFYGK